MTATTARLDAIEARLEAATPGSITITPSDIDYLLTLARKQAAALEAVNVWVGRHKTGFYDEAQDDVFALIRAALGDGDE